MGKVYLVGAGPGDPNLITKKGYDIIKKADVIVYDRLANEELLKYRKKNSKLIYVGKLPNRHIVKQDRINEILIEESKTSEVVLRLKGGDPYVFGRGAEEAEALYDSGIEFEVVPGISSSIGGLCYAGIPVTHRDFSPSFHVITGHRRQDEEIDICWEALAKETGTLIFLMGVSNAKNISDNLIKFGRDKDTPVAFISWASTPMQKKYITTLESVQDCIEKNSIKPPSLFVVGDVVKAAEKLSFFERKPLFSKKIAITRTRSQSSNLRERLEESGAYVVEIPTIRICRNSDIDDEIIDLLDNKKYDYIAFTSKNSSLNLLDILKENRYDIRKLANIKMASIGKSVQDYLESKGIFSDIVSSESNSKDLAKKISVDIYESFFCGDKSNVFRGENTKIDVEKDDYNHFYSVEDKLEIRVLYPCSELANDDFKNCLFDSLINLIDRDNCAKKILYNSSQSELNITMGNRSIVLYFDRLDIYTNEVNIDDKEYILDVLLRGVDVVTFTSSSTFKNLCEVLGEEKIGILRDIKLLSIGKNTSREIESRGFEPIQSEISSIESMVEKIIEIYKLRGEKK